MLMASCFCSCCCFCDSFSLSRRSRYMLSRTFCLFWTTCSSSTSCSYASKGFTEVDFGCPSSLATGSFSTAGAWMLSITELSWQLDVFDCLVILSSAPCRLFAAFLISLMAPTMMSFLMVWSRSSRNSLKTVLLFFKSCYLSITISFYALTPFK